MLFKNELIVFLSKIEYYYLLLIKINLKIIFFFTFLNCKTIVCGYVSIIFRFIR
jgi:hypothetical protein